MMHPDIAMMNGRERVKEMLAEAERRRRARQAREAARAGRSARRLASDGSAVPALQGRFYSRLNARLQGLSRALLRGAR